MSHLVRVRRDGNRIYYAADDAHVGRLVEEALWHSGHLAGIGAAAAGPQVGEGRRA